MTRMNHQCPGDQVVMRCRSYAHSPTDFNISYNWLRWGWLSPTLALSRIASACKQGPRRGALADRLTVLGVDTWSLPLSRIIILWSPFSTHPLPRKAFLNSTLHAAMGIPWAQQQRLDNTHTHTNHRKYQCREGTGANAPIPCPQSIWSTAM